MQKIKFNNSEIPFPLTWNETAKTIKTTFMTEGGTDEELIVRRDKLVISCSFKCTDYWVRVFKSFYRLNEFILRQYDPWTNDEESRTVRMHDFSYGLVKKSWDIDEEVTQGIWEVSFTLEEF